jgi:hypothetical protein
VYCAFSERDGSFSINGPGAGRYMVFAEPLDGPATPEQLYVQDANAYYQGMNTSFRTSFAGEIKLGIGSLPRSVRTNITVPTGAPSLNIDRMGRGDAATGIGYLAEGALVVSPGETLSLWIGGANTSKTASLNDITILGSGINLDTSRGIRILKNAAGSPTGISVIANVAADAMPGPRTLLLKVGDEQVASTGGIIVAARALPASSLYFPFFKALPGEYTGIALANLAADPATVRISARDASGAFLWSQDSTVPSDITIPSGAQYARVDRQIFNLTQGASFNGSVTVESESPNLQGFFSTGDLAMNYLDGAEAFSRGYKQLHFVDVIQNTRTSCEIHLMNVKDVPMSVDLALTAADGNVLSAISNRAIPAGGKISGTVAELFGYSAPLASAHITASTTEDSLAGFQVIRQANAIAGLNAISAESGASLLYDPQLAVGNIGLHFDTRLNLVNIGKTAATASISLMDEEGQTLRAAPKTVTLVPGGQLSLDVRKSFNIDFVQGYIRVAAPEGSKLIGNVFFGNADPTEDSLNFAASLPLFESGTRDLVFSHVAQSAGYYTGLAVMLPPEVFAGANVSVEVFDSAGKSNGSSSFAIKPGQRKVCIIGALFPETNGQTGGYVRLTSDQPVISFEIFGSTDGRMLAAVPPQRYLR